MKILIVDDNINKIKDIMTQIKEIDNEIEIDYCMEIIEGKRKMSDKYYDLLVLDIMLPERINSNVLNDGGINLLREIRKKDKYKYPGIIIGMTSDKEIVEKFKSEFFSMIYYDTEYCNWKDELKNYISLGINTIVRLEKSDEVDYKYDIGIVCAVKQKELIPVREIFQLSTEVKPKNDCLSYYQGTLNINGKKIKVVATSCDEMGLTSTAVVSMKLIEKYRPKYLFMTGICAGVRGKGEFGDIIVADPIWNYGNGKYSEKNGEEIFEPDPKPLRIDIDIANIIDNLRVDKELFKNIKREFEGTRPESELKCLRGAFASGDAVIATKRKIDTIKEQSRKLLGIDMESYSVHYAGNYCTKVNPKVITMKSISDFGDEEKGDNYQKYAAYTSSKFLYKVVEQIFNEE